MPDYRRRAAQEAMSVCLDFNGVMADVVGAAGVSRDDIDALAGRISEVRHALKGRREAGELPFFDLPYQPAALKEIKSVATAMRGDSDHLVVLGIGGSALGTKTLVEALAADGPRVTVADNVDPWSFGRLLDGLDLSRTAFNVISKSGETA